VAEVNVIIVTAVRPVDDRIGQQRHPDATRVAVGNEILHLVKGGEQRFPQQRDVVQVKDGVDSYHCFDDLSRGDRCLTLRIQRL
jgi:hypothetical protein